MEEGGLVLGFSVVLLAATYGHFIVSIDRIASGLQLIKQYETALSSSKRYKVS